MILWLQAHSASAADNPLGVEWVGGNQAGPSAPPSGSQAPGNNPLGVDWVGGTPVEKPPAPSGQNPLGVDWVGGSQSKQPAPASGGNPLGIEWQTGLPATSPTPAKPQEPKPVQPLPQQPVTPRPQPAPTQPSPEPVTPPPVVSPSPDVTPAPDPNAAWPASVLVDTWKYLAVVFTDASGTVSETRGVRGSLIFKADGRYEQTLYIGDILNALKGEYRISGNRVETRYTWRGQRVTDAFEVYLDPSAKRLTLSGTGIPRAVYTLERVE